MRAEGYSIWLMPKDEVYEKYARIIGDLSQRFGTPNFEPHVTLVGGLKGSADLIEGATRLLSTMSPSRRILIALREFGTEDFYFRALYLKAQRSNILQLLNERANLVFKRPIDSGYMPHLSLLYGDLTEGEKQQIIGGLNLKLPDQFVIDGLHLWQTEGEVRDWKQVSEYPFSRVY